MRRISVENLKPGMELFQPVFDESHKVLLNRGVKLTDQYIDHFKDLGYRGVYITSKLLSDVKYEPLISEDNMYEAIRHLNLSYKHIHKLIHDFKDKSSAQILENLRTGKFKKAFAQTNIYNSTNRIADKIIDDVITCSYHNGVNSLKTPGNYQYYHTIDTIVAAILIAKNSKLNRRQILELVVGLFFYDVGKIFIPRDVLEKKGKLSDEEFEKVKVHPDFGYELLHEVFPIMSTHLAYQHHEWQDGSGYPRGIKGLNTIKRAEAGSHILLFGEIAGVADAYDALISDRPHRQAIPHDEAIEEMKSGSYSQFNQEVLNKLLELTPHYPVGSSFKIMSGGKYKDCNGVVVNVNEEDLNLPMLRLLYDSKGTKIKPIELSMRKMPDLQIKLINE
ncbi:MAG: HD domain-containing protein [bacterium]|nr:HD domain-containing protein [bacterium]